MKLQQVELRYGNRKILSDLNVEIRPGEFVFLIGASGSGKTSFIRTLVGELEPIAGRVLDDFGNDLYRYKPKELALYRRRI